MNKESFSYGIGFHSLEREIVDPVQLQIQGELPRWLEGTLFRTGPSKFEVGQQTYNHWFDGLAMLHRFAFAEGRASYANRFLRSRAYREAERTGRISYREFATDPCRTLFGRLVAVFNPEPTDNCCVNVSNYGGEMVVFTESRLPIRFAPETLATLGVFDYEKQLRGQVSCAHPHFDAARECHYNHMIEFGLRSVYHLFRVKTSGTQEHVAEIPVDSPAYIHSFAMTEHYLVLVEFPLVVSALELKFSGRPFIQNYRWRPERGLRFHVIDKENGREVATARSDAAFAFHHVNAFEDEDILVIDIVAYPDPSIIDQLYLARLRAGTPIDATGMLTRFRVPLGETPVVRQTLAPVALELPRINYENHVGKPYRYIWGAGAQVAGDFLDNIVKIDVETGSVASWYEPGCYPGEPIFVGAPAAKAEDDGAILSVVLDSNKGISFLIVLDAATLTERARALAPHAIPFHFHGNYFPAAMEHRELT
jgi:carotenoid cleavage dioxygenase-like enzyme